MELVEACGREPLGISVAAGVDRASLVFADSSPGGGAPPLLELCVRDVQCSGQGVLGSAADALDGALKATLCLEVYNAEKKASPCRLPLPLHLAALSDMARGRTDTRRGVLATNLPGLGECGGAVDGPGQGGRLAAVAPVEPCRRCARCDGHGVDGPPPLRQRLAGIPCLSLHG